MLRIVFFLKRNSNRLPSTSFNERSCLHPKEPLRFLHSPCFMTRRMVKLTVHNLHSLVFTPLLLGSTPCLLPVTRRFIPSSSSSSSSSSLAGQADRFNARKNFKRTPSPPSNPSSPPNSEDHSDNKSKSMEGPNSDHSFSENDLSQKPVLRAPVHPEHAKNEPEFSSKHTGNSGERKFLGFSFNAQKLREEVSKKIVWWTSYCEESLSQNFSARLGNVASLRIFISVLVLVVLLYAYYTSANRRALARLLDREMTQNIEKVKDLVQQVKKLEEKWKNDLFVRDRQIRALVEENVAQTKTLDKLVGSIKRHLSLPLPQREPRQPTPGSSPSGFSKPRSHAMTSEEHSKKFHRHPRNYEEWRTTFGPQLKQEAKQIPHSEKRATRAASFASPASTSRSPELKENEGLQDLSGKKKKE